MKTVHPPYKGDQNRQSYSSPKKIEVGHFEYLNRTLMTTSAVERLAVRLYSWLVSAKTGPCPVFEVTPTTVKISGEGIRSTLSVDLATVVPVTETATQDNRIQSDETDSDQKETNTGDTRLE